MIITNLPAAPPAQPLKCVHDYDVNGNMIYEGWAAPGAAITEPYWSIRKNTFDVNNRMTVSEMCDGNCEFDNVWNDRALLTYA